MRRGFAVVCAIVLASSAGALADTLPNTLPDTVQATLREYWKTKAQDLLTNLVQTDLISAYIFDRVVEEQRIGMPLSLLRGDLQLGSLNPSSGSTSVVARPGATDLLSAAMESGAVSRTADDKSATFGFNALPIYQLMKGSAPQGCGSLANDCRKGPGRWIRGLSGSVSLSTSTATTVVPADLPSVLAGTPAIAAFVTGSRTVQAVAGRYELFVRERDNTAAQAALDQAATALSTKVSAFLGSQAKFEERLQQIIDSSGWKAGTLSRLTKARSLDEMSALLLERYQLLYTLVANAPELQAARDEANKERLSYVSAQNKLLAEKLYRKALTADYLYRSPSDQPKAHELRLAFSTPLGSKPADSDLSGSTAAAVPGGALTFNAGVSWYADAVTGRESRVRDTQVSCALDWSPSAWGTVRPTYTVAYYFQYMADNALIQFTGEALTPGGAAIPLARPAIEVLNTKGPIHVAQMRMNFPVGTTGVSFPFAVSYSSRAELIAGNKSFWQGHVGVSYDFSNLKSFLRPAANR